MWFTRGFVEYQFPNNAKLAGSARRRRLELSMELSSEVPGTLEGLAVGHHRLRSTGTRSTPGPRPATSATSAATSRRTGGSWQGSQYGELKLWRVTADGHLSSTGCAISDCHAWRSGPERPPLDPGSDRRQGRRPPPRRHQHLRPRLRQPRPGHRPASDPRLSGSRLDRLTGATGPATIPESLV